MTIARAAKFIREGTGCTFVPRSTEPEAGKRSRRHYGVAHGTGSKVGELVKTIKMSVETLSTVDNH